MKAVMISIKPKWCSLISSGEKTVEVRKTKPKLDLPFKVYIYCTANKQGVKDLLEIHGTDGKIRKANGKVIGEFICDGIKDFHPTMDLKHLTPRHANMVDESQVSMTDLFEYANGKILYGWHISDLVIYDKPKELCEFTAWKKCNSCKISGYESSACIYDEDCKVPAMVTRPPQSWCYVEQCFTVSAEEV